MKKIKKSMLAALVVLQLMLPIGVPRSEAIILGITTGGGGALIILGSLYTLNGAVLFKGAKQQSDFNAIYIALALGLVLDENATPALIDPKLEMPESLELAYGPETANRVWLELSEVDHALESQTLKLEIPERIQTFLASKQDCNSKCKKELKVAEKEFVATVKSKLEAVVNDGRPVASRLALSDTTVRYLIENFGYTFSASL